MIATGLAQMIPVLHPGLAWAAAAAGLIPVVIHLINRRRYRRIPWAAMSFLLAANRRSAKRMRLEQLLLMACRIGVVVLAGMALARPHLPESGLSSMVSSRAHRIVILDNSLSMQAVRSDGRARFDAARAAANRLVASFPPDDGVSVVTTAEPATEMMIGRASFDRRMTRDRLASIEATQRRNDTPGALTIALKIVKESDAAPGNRFVYVISDFTASVWESGLPGQPSMAASEAGELADALGGTEPRLYLIGVEPGPSENVSVGGISPESRLIGINVPARFEVGVQNDGLTTASGLSLQVRAEGQTIRRQSLSPIAPGKCVRVSFSTEFSTPGVKLIEARLVSTSDDALSIDDAARMSAEVRAAAPALLVDGRPGARLLDGQAGYLATALAPRGGSTATGTGGGDGATLVEPRIITEAELRGEALSNHDLVALCNVSQLSPDLWERMEAFVRGGGGLMIFLGDQVNVENYNRFGYAEGKGLLPGRLERSPDAPAIREQRLGFQLTDRPHPIVCEFADSPASGLFLARVDRYVPLQTDERRGEIVLKYTNGDAAMVIGRHGSGRVVVWTTSADMAWTNLPGKGDFVALMLSAASAIAPSHGEHRNLSVGESLIEPLAPEESSMPMRLVLGDGTPAEPSIVPHGDGLAASFGPIEKAQELTLTVGPSTRKFAVNVDSPGNLRAADREALIRAIGRPVRWIAESDESFTADKAASPELSSALLLGTLLLLFGETWLARRFGSGGSDVSRGDGGSASGPGGRVP